MSRKEKIDFYLGKLMSRKLLTLTIATIALFTNKLEGDYTSETINGYTYKYINI